MSAKIKMLRYALHVKGLYGRNRKVKFDVIKLCDRVEREQPRQVADLLPIFSAKLAEIKFRGGRARLVEEPVDVEIYDTSDGKTVEVESYMLMSGKTLHTEDRP